MSDVAIRVENLGKRYQLGEREPYKALRDVVGRALRKPWRRSASARSEPAEIWALRHLSCEVKTGEVLGVIGANGAGKSTLLKILSRITQPTEGSAVVRGRVGSLLEVGTGFHHELTGRENVFLNGAILGMTKREITRRFDEIVGFAGVEPFIDTPVKYYSSGMYVRLAFAVAAHLEPDILLVDEVLAVGDARFQEKCLGRMSQISRGGRTIFFVSHNMNAVLQLCTQVLWIDRGQIAAVGPPERGVRAYLAMLQGHQEVAAARASLDGHPGRRKAMDGVLRLTHCQVLGDDIADGEVLMSGGRCRVILGYRSSAPLRGCLANFVVTFRTQRSQRLASCWSQMPSEELGELGEEGEVECCIPRLPLMPGRYVLDVGCQVASGWSDMIYEAVMIDVRGGPFYASGWLPPSAEMGPCLMDYIWSKRNEGDPTTPSAVSHDAPSTINPLR